jgi:hypothetical protein
MVGTDEFQHGPALGGAQPLAAMAAHVDEGADLAVGATHQDDGIGAHLQCEIAAALGQLRAVGHEQPFAVEDQIEVQLVDVLIGVKLACEPGVWCTRAQLAQQIGGCRHAQSP